MCRSTSSTKRCRAACARRGERAQRAQHEELVLRAQHGGHSAACTKHRPAFVAHVRYRTPILSLPSPCPPSSACTAVVCLLNFLPPALALCAGCMIGECTCELNA